MKKIFLLLFICVVISPAWAETSSQQAVSTFVKAGFAYKDGKYAEASGLYESILSDGWESGPVYYNLANSYYKQGALGKSLLNYERARRLMPRDGDLKANLKYVQSLQKQNLQPPQPVWAKLVDGHVQFYTLDEMALILFCLTLVMGTLHLCSLYFAWPPGRAAGILAVTAVLWAVYAGGLFIKAQGDSRLSVVVADTASKFEPRAEATTHFELYEGAKVRVIKKQGVWFKIKRLDGKMGWVSQETVERL